MRLKAISLTVILYRILLLLRVCYWITCGLLLWCNQLKLLHSDKQYRCTIPLTERSAWHFDVEAKIERSIKICLSLCTYSHYVNDLWIQLVWLSSTCICMYIRKLNQCITKSHVKQLVTTLSKYTCRKQISWVTDIPEVGRGIMPGVVVMAYRLALLYGFTFVSFGRHSWSMLLLRLYMPNRNIK